MSEFLIIFVLYLLSTPFILWKLFLDYQNYGKLTRLGSVLHILVYVIHGMFMGFCLWGGRVATTIGWNFQTGLGLFVAVVGLILTIAGMNFFRSLRKHTGLETGKLDTEGLYAWSRHPQFVGYGIILIGFSIVWYNQWIWAGLAAYFLLAYGAALIEEEHLLRVFGDEYSAYSKRVPRFFRLRK